MAKIQNVMSKEIIEVKSTTDHSCSSYGMPVWVDSENNAYCQVGMEAPFYTIVEQ